MPDVSIEFPKLSEIINENFEDIFFNEDRYLLLYGSRGSSKSNFAAKKKIYQCLTFPYFRDIMIRESYNTIKDSQFQTIKDIIHEWGLGHLFRFKENPLEIHCKNGNSFYARGCDDVDNIKSIKDPTGAWYEEANNISMDDFITITTSIRTTKAKYLQEILSFNPECDGDYEDFWIYKMFFGGLENGLSGRGVLEVQLSEFEVLKTDYMVHHSNFKTNRWVGDSFRAQLEQLKNIDPYYYDVYALGIWGKKKATNPFFSAYDQAKHLGRVAYDYRKPLYISIDFNLNPFSVSFYHLWRDGFGEHLHCFDEMEIFGGSIPELADRINAKYGMSLPMCKITGDAMGNRGDISQRDNSSLYLQLVRLLNGVRVNQLYTPPNPTHENSRADCNYFLHHFNDFKVDTFNCKGMVRDLSNMQVDSFNSIIKKNRKDVNQRADFGDNLRYMINTFMFDWIKKHSKGQGSRIKKK